MATIGAQYDIPSGINIGKKQQYVKVGVRPYVLDNHVYWQVFDSDHQIVNFFEEEVKISGSNQEQLH